MENQNEANKLKQIYESILFSFRVVTILVVVYYEVRFFIYCCEKLGISFSIKSIISSAWIVALPLFITQCASIEIMIICLVAWEKRGFKHLKPLGKWGLITGLLVGPTTGAIIGTVGGFIIGMFGGLVGGLLIERSVGGLIGGFMLGTIGGLVGGLIIGIQGEFGAFDP